LFNFLMFIHCTIRCITRDQQCAFGRHNTQNHDNPAHRSRNHTFYDTPPVRLYFKFLLLTGAIDQ
jgi:hypothetical protein